MDSTVRKFVYDRDLFNRFKLFRTVSPEAVETHLESCQHRHIKKGQTLLKPDENNPFVYVIASGAVSVHLRSPNSEPVAILQVGDCVGEMSMIESREPAAYVLAKDDCDLLVIDHQTLSQLISVSHGVARNLLLILSERLRHDNSLIANSLNSMAQFEHSATRDALTDLHNRHWMHDMFRREMQRCKNKGHDACLIMLDVDGFKTFNDRSGHLAGDHALTKVADTLRGQLRPTDLIARFGGDEFVVLLPDADLETAHAAAERIRNVFCSGDTDGTDLLLPITLSLGVAEMQPNDSLDSLLQKADRALYSAKAQGKNQTTLYTA